MAGKGIPVAIPDPIVALGTTFVTDVIEIPGIVTAAAYQDGDAFGTKFKVAVPKDGVIATALLFGLDDEGIQKDIFLFEGDFVQTADNAAFAPTDADLLKSVGFITIDVFSNVAANQLGVASPALFYVAPQGFLWGQVVTRGADNIAAANIPRFRLVIAQ